MYYENSLQKMEMQFENILFNERINEVILTREFANERNFRVSSIKRD